MEKKMVAKGQVTITTLKDAFHISQSVGEYIFPALSDGTVASAVTVVSTIEVKQGNNNYTGFTIGSISKPAGFNAITVDNGEKTVTYSVAAHTTTLAEHGSLKVPVLIEGVTYYLSFQWAKAKSGAAGSPGTDANLLAWRDSNGETIGYAGFDSSRNFNFTVRNHLGDIVLLSRGSVNVTGTLKIEGTAIGDIYVSRKTFTDALAQKVDIVTGKQLSAEDFTTDYKKKLDGISSGSLVSGGDGFVKASEVTEALGLKLSADMNLRDVTDQSAARRNLDVYSKVESGNTFLKISGKLQELVTLSADEINGLTTEEAAALKARKQADVRDNIAAETKGTGDLKLAKASNLSDVSDKGKARKNMDVYSTDEIDRMLSGKLGIESAYEGVVFTPAMHDKLDGIATGNFAYTDAEGKSHAQVDGYAMVPDVARELKKKANLLLDGYSTDQKNTVAANLGIYTKNGADARFAVVESLFQDYITYLVKSGKTTVQAQQALRDKLDVLSKVDLITISFMLIYFKKIKRFSVILVYLPYNI